MIIADEEQRDQAEAEYAQAASVALATTEQIGDTYGSLGVTMRREFSQAMTDRLLTEQRWLKDLRQYRGQYEPDEEAAMGANRSKSFIRKTRVKVKTVNARIIELLFPAGKEQNFSIGPTPKPSISDEQKSTIVDLLTKALGKQPSDIEIDQAIRQVVEKASEGMSITIQDQLAECRYKQAAKQVVHSGNLYGTGVLKAPLVERKIRERFVHKAGKWQIVTEQYTVPFLDFVPLWRIYPDMTATNIEDCRYIYERHLMPRAAMRKLAQRKSFNSAKINAYVTANPKGYLTLQLTDTALKIIGQRQATQHTDNGLYEVLERWGWLSTEQLRDAGVKIPQDRENEEFFCNVWCLPNGEVIRAVIQPINGVTWPYKFYYFDKDETSIFGEGLAAIMRDDQATINAVVRMILDNAALTAGPMFEVAVGLLSNQEKLHDIHPFKVWPRNREQPGQQAVKVIEMPGNLEDLSRLYALFDNDADEVSVVPKYASGSNPTQGAGGTASGLSMLMAAQGVTIKDLIVAYDEGITKPFISDLYRWNMQFSKDDTIKGDFDVVALGVASLMAKEVRATQLNQFNQTISPADEPFIKRFKLITQRAEANDLTDIVKTQDEVDAENNSEQARQAAQLADMQQKLMLATLQGQVHKLDAEVKRILADAARIDADAVGRRIDGAYSAMQAGSVAVTNPGVAKAGDELLRASGWQDKTAPEVNGAPPEANAQPTQPAQGQQQPIPASPNIGLHRGMNTSRVTDNING